MIQSIDPYLHGCPWPQIFECFLVYCVEDAFRRITPLVADGYVSHVLKFIEHQQGDYSVRAGARTALYKAAFSAFQRDHLASKPLRLRARIPFTVPFIIWTLGYIERTYADAALQRVLKAAIATGHALSLRPGEYLESTHHYETERFLGAASTYAWFNGEPYCATAVKKSPSA